MKADSDEGTPNNVSSIVSCYQTWRTILVKFPPKKTSHKGLEQHEGE